MDFIWSMTLGSICYGGHPGQERWCLGWSCWAPKPAQVGSLLHLHCFLRDQVRPSWLQVVVAGALPIPCNSHHGLQQSKGTSVTVSTPGPFGLDHKVEHCNEFLLLPPAWPAARGSCWNSFDVWQPQQW